MAAFGYVGGKSRIASRIVSHFPMTFSSYYEPFLGSGAVLIQVLQSRKITGRVVASDINAKVIMVHKAIKDDVDKLIHDFQSLIVDRSEAEYYRIRREFNANPDAPKFVYINAFGFNGLYRENSEGACNVAWGHARTFNLNVDRLRSISRYVHLGRAVFELAAPFVKNATLRRLYNEHDVQFRACSWVATLKLARAGDVVYLDPPYVDAWTGFTKHGFDDLDTEDLVDWMLSTRASVVYSNHDTKRVRYILRRGFAIHKLQVQRSCGRVAVDSGMRKISAAEIVATINMQKPNGGAVANLFRAAVAAKTVEAKTVAPKTASRRKRRRGTQVVREGPPRKIRIMRYKIVEVY